MIERLDTYLVIPLAFSALTTGVVVSLTTKWGLSRYWWVLCKLMLTGAVILFSTHGVGRWVQSTSRRRSRRRRRARWAHRWPTGPP